MGFGGKISGGGGVNTGKEEKPPPKKKNHFKRWKTPEKRQKNHGKNAEKNGKKEGREEFCVSQTIISSCRAYSMTCVASSVEGIGGSSAFCCRPPKL